jgi:hypothetical protein
MKKKTCFSFLIAIMFPVSISAQSQKGTMLTGNTQNEQFGRNVKISTDGTVLAVGAPLNSEHGDQDGRIAVYKFDGNNWQMMGNEIWPGATDFRYGEIMELSGNGEKLVAASPFGGISFYTFDGRDWVRSSQVIHLENKNDQVNSISITPNAQKIAVAFDCEKHRTACIKIFNFEGEQWTQDGPDLIPCPNEKIYTLALSLSPDGQLLVVGNYSKDTKLLKNAGEVVFYTKEGNQWERNNKTFLGEALSANLGSGVAASKNGGIVIAASNSIDLLDRNTGFVETYEMDTNGWTKKNKTLKPDKQNSYFGHSISLSADGTVMALSMPYLGFGKPGFVKIYKNALSGWKETAVIYDANGIETTSSPNNSTGWSIALSSDGKTLAVGFPHNDENGDMSGKVVVYDLTNPQ